MRRDRNSKDAAAAVALDALTVLLRWCHDPVLAEQMDGFDGFADAVTCADHALEKCRAIGWQCGVGFPGDCGQRPKGEGR